jgi:ribosomal protein S19
MRTWTWIQLYIAALSLVNASVAEEATGSQSLFDMLIAPQLVKKFIAFYGTRKFITVFITTYYWTLS